MTAANARRSSREVSPAGGASSPYAERTIEPDQRADPRAATARRAARAARRAAPRAGARSPPRPGPERRSRGRGAAPRRSRRRRGRSRSTASAGSVELPAAAAAPGEAEQREQRVAERRQREADPRLDRVRDPEPAEHGLERRAPALDRRDDQRDLLGAVPPRSSASSSSPTSSSVPRVPAPARKRTRRSAPAVGGGLEQRALEVRERRGAILGRAGRQLLDAAGRERREIVGRARERRERGAAGLVGQRDVDLGAAGERLEQRPLRGGQILEAVGEDRLAVPGVEIAAEPLARARGAAGRDPRARARSSSAR